MRVETLAGDMAVTQVTLPSRPSVVPRLAMQIVAEETPIAMAW
jgi:hypothetical protein